MKFKQAKLKYELADSQSNYISIAVKVLETTVHTACCLFAPNLCPVSHDEQKQKKIHFLPFGRNCSLGLNRVL